MNIRVYYEDTDCGGVVYHSNYLNYMERGRTEFLRDHGVNLADYHKEGTVFAVTEVEIKYRHPAVYNDLLTVKTELTELSAYRLEFTTHIYNEAGTLCSKGTAKVVAVSQKTGKLTVIDEAFFNKMRDIYRG